MAAADAYNTYRYSSIKITHNNNNNIQISG
jgi:hypothetical protein